MDFPIFKQKIKRFYNPEWDFLGELHLKQATIQEFLEFQDKSQENQLELLSVELMSMYKYSLIEKLIKFFKPQYIPSKLIKLQILLLQKDKEGNYMDKILIEIVEYRYWWTSIYDWVKLLDIKWSWENRPVFPWKSMKNICKAWNIPWPKVLLNEYTMEQYVFMQDTEIFDWFEQDKEWKINNDRAMKGLNKWNETELTTEEIMERLPKMKD